MLADGGKKMQYEQQHVMKAFQLYSRLAVQGYIEQEDVECYLINEDIQSLLEQFVREVDAILVHAGDVMYLVPITGLSPFHIKNEQIRKEFGANAVNADVYMMYFAMLVFIGEFYNSYQSGETQRDFLTINEWLAVVNARIITLRQHSPEELQQASEDLQYNWISILEKWDALNDIKESAVSQKGNTVSRLSFLDKVLQFMLKEKVVSEIGPGEYDLTEKTKTIVQRYFMEFDYNRGILQFMYQYDERKEEEHANDR